jgi:hypothetical protein
MKYLSTMISAMALLTVVTGPAYSDTKEKTVFVTSTSFNGNIGGLAGADDKCQAGADGPTSIVPEGTYRAWLSDGTDSPDTRFTKSSHPYILPDGTKIAEDFADLTDGSLLHPINVEANGKNLGLAYIWTGTNSDGTTAPDYLTCDKWTADPVVNFHGKGGRTNRVDKLWSDRIARVSCARRHRLWCFQQ